MKVSAKYWIMGATIFVIAMLWLNAFFKAAQVARTYDTLGQIIIGTSKTLTLQKWNTGYDAEAAVHQIFPDLKFVNGTILDSWNRPIQIEIRHPADHFILRAISSGPDGTFGTKDDCIKEWELSDNF